MKIGIDLDGVVIDSERQFRNAAELYDIFELKRNSIIDESELLIQNKYNWTKEEFQEFAEKFFVECTRRSNIMPGAKEVIELLRKDGHELIVITARGHDFSAMRQEGEKILDRAGITFDKYYWGIDDKVKIGKQEGIDLMIEDSIHNCKKFADAGIKSIYLRDSNMKHAENAIIKECFIWADIYRYIMELEKNK